MKCLKQCEKDLQNEKKKINKYNLQTRQILYQFKESEEFIDTLIKRLKMSKSTIMFEIFL